MNDTTKINDIPEEAREAELIGYLTNTYLAFTKLNFTKRKRGLNVFRQVGSKSTDADLIEINLKIESLFIEKHIKLTIAEIREKYRITKKPTEKDFYRICKGENITIVNSLPDAKSKGLKKYGCYFTAPENRFFLSFDERETGKQRLHTQFQMLGIHFLHRDEMPDAENAFDNKTSEFQRSNALLFALMFVDTKPMPEVKNAEKED